MYTFEQLQRGYTNLYNDMQIRSDWMPVIDRDARKIIANKKRYIPISDDTGVPWEVIGLIHLLEAGCDFTKHLHNGDSLEYRTSNVPAGRPKKGSPPFTFEESAVDALTYDGLLEIDNWTPARVAFELEKYNGFGYFKYNINSPYLWSGTTNYVRGKFVSDGHFDRDAVSKQCGAMGVYSRIKELDVKPAQIVQASRKMTVLNGLRNSFVMTGGTYLTWDNLQVFPDWLHKLKQYSFDNSYLIIIGVIFVVAAVVQIIKNMTVEDFQNGNYVPTGMVNTQTSLTQSRFEDANREYKFTPGAYVSGTDNAKPVTNPVTAPNGDKVPTMADFVPEVTASV